MAAPHILLVDPSDEHRAILVSLLRAAGYDADSTSGGAAALQRIRRRKPDLIVGEHPMPLKDGRPLCEVLADEPGTRDIPFIALTARAMPDALRSARASHPAGVLTKPVTLARIMEAVLECVGPAGAGSGAAGEESADDENAAEAAL